MTPLSAWMVIYGLFGLCIGSFLNVAVWRIPRGESVVHPGSHCPGCERELKPLELIPVLSFILLRGRCRGCKTLISWRYPFVELVTGLLFSGTVWRFGHSPEAVLFSLLMALVFAAALTDLDHMIIPDTFVISSIVLAAAALLIHGFRGWLLFEGSWWLPVTGVLAGSGALALVSGIAFLILRREGFGMGDIKMLFPVGIMLGGKLTLCALMTAVISGALVSVVLLAGRKIIRRQEIPFWPFLAFGTWLSMMYGYDIIRLYLDLVLQR